MKTMKTSIKNVVASKMMANENARYYQYCLKSLQEASAFGNLGRVRMNSVRTISFRLVHEENRFLHLGRNLHSQGLLESPRQWQLDAVSGVADELWESLLVQRFQCLVIREIREGLV